MTNGKVKWFNGTKGYGFIEAENGSNIFVHRTGFSNPERLSTGDELEFEVKQGEKGLIAVNVKLKVT